MESPNASLLHKSRKSRNHYRSAQRGSMFVPALAILFFAGGLCDLVLGLLIMTACLPTGLTEPVDSSLIGALLLVMAGLQTFASFSIRRSWTIVGTVLSVKVIPTVAACAILATGGTMPSMLRMIMGAESLFAGACIGLIALSGEIGLVDLFPFRLPRR